MTFLEVIGFIVSLVARAVLLFSGIPFLVSSVAFARLIFDLMATKSSYSDELTSIGPASAANVNLYSIALIASAIYLISFAIYAIYVAIFSYKQGLKGLIIIGLVTFTIGVLVFMLSSPSLETLNKESVPKLKDYQALYDWNHIDVPAEIDPARQATLLWDFVQESLRCCGYRDPSDWAPYKPIWLALEDVLPRTCCRDVEEAKIRGGGYCRADMPRWTKNCSSEVHRAVMELFGMVGMTIYFGLMSCLLSGIILIIHPYEASDDYYESYADGFNIYHLGRQNPNTINAHTGLIYTNDPKSKLGGAPMHQSFHYGSY